MDASWPLLSLPSLNLMIASPAFEEPNVNLSQLPTPLP